MRKSSAKKPCTKPWLLFDVFLGLDVLILVAAVLVPYALAALVLILIAFFLALMLLCLFVEL